MRVTTKVLHSLAIALCAITLMGNDSCQPDTCTVDGDCDEGLVCIAGLCGEVTECVCTADYAPVCGVDGETYGNRCEADCETVDVDYEGECGDVCAPVLCLIACPYGFVEDDAGCATCECAPSPSCFSNDDCADGEVCDVSECFTSSDCEEGRDCDAACYGECVPEVCSCPENWEPVCGADGNTYGNMCEADCADVDVDYRGECGEGCDCPDVWDPVCGADGETYGNSCEARCAGVSIESRGECETGCICTEGYAPVCGVDGNTYSNACFAECEDVEIDYRGECGEDCICTLEYAPVCGVDGRTYGNSCQAGCADVEIDYRGECEEVCACPRIYAPVCGVDGETYSNSCVAECADVDIDYRGECVASCEDNDECPRDQICYPGSDTCQPICEIACFRYDPVCGTDGVTYGCGQADAWCHGVEVAYDGECSEDCICIDLFDPVCGVDGETYGNSCRAGCAGVEVDYRGECSSAECRSNESCPRGEICYPPTDVCQPECSIACFRYDPVCGTDGVTYGCGQEDAWCHGAEVDYTGECGTTCDDVLCDVWCEYGHVLDEEGCETCECNPAPTGCWADEECDRGERCEFDERCLGPPCREGDLHCGCPGACVPDDACECPTDVYAPVCGVDGVTYGQPCEARCAGVEVAYEGECGAVCVCTAHYDPVCGVDGETYGNSCAARCAGVEIAYEGECRDTACRSNDDCDRGEVCNPGTNACGPECSVACFRYDPVCGVDGVTYGCGQADAWCHGIAVDYEGECRDTCEPVACRMYCPFGWEVDDTGCEVCGCAEPDLCLSNDHCGSDQKCDTENYCYSRGDLAVCYGACVDR